MIEFLKETYQYLVERIETALKNVDLQTVERILQILKEGAKDKRITVAGAGRSLQSALLLSRELESTYGIRVNCVNNANLRPLRRGDIFLANSRSGTGKIIDDAEFAQNKGLQVIFITANKKLKDKFENVIYLKKNGHEEKYAPLGTEFEQASATLCACLAYSYDKDNPIGEFKKSCKNVINGFYKNLQNLKTQEQTIKDFIFLIEDYLDIENDGVVYFKGTGINEIIIRVIAIRYGHLHKEGSKDLNVVYESHWRCRRNKDLAILLSGSGQTDQIIKDARQAGDVGMRIFAITSFKNSKLARTNRWYKLHAGNLIIEGRPEMISYYNKSLFEIVSPFFPQFELNTYLTLDSLLALIAKRNNITEEDMKKTHRDKELE
ncbi:MAG: hypothetical protein ACOC44_04990 [Promethearchaeia archaeon]